MDTRPGFTAMLVFGLIAGGACSGSLRVGPDAGGGDTAHAVRDDDAGQVSVAGSGGTPGVWENVTPAGVSLEQGDPGDGDNYGVQDVLADPLRPSDLYAFICYQGVWRSTDFGLTWTQANAGSDWGKPWGTAIDPNPMRDPSTSPTLYAGFSNAWGFGRSTDFGATWTITEVPDQPAAVYSVDVDPYDGDHVLISFHEAGGVGESFDGGRSWTLHDTPGGGGSYYPFFIDTGMADTTRITWLVIPQEQSPARAIRTINGGADWIALDQFQHHHGSAQIFDARDGLIYIAAMSSEGIYRSTDYGATWTMLSDVSSGIVTATRRYLYTSVGYGWGSIAEPLDPHLARAPRDDDTNWTRMDVPEDMIDGAKRMATTNDGVHDIVVAGSWHAGIWRYVEPD